MAAQKVASSQDYGKNEIQNVRMQNLSSAPSTPVEGQMYYDTATHAMFVYNGTTWKSVDATVGSYLHSIISDFDTQVRTSRLDQMAAPSSDLSMSSHKITNLTDGASAQDAATYGQLLAMVNGLDWKNSVRVATTANITLSGTQTIDTVSVIAGDRVLVKDQSTGANNGIYVVASGAWTRATDADTSAKVTAGLAVFVSEGSANGDKQFKLTTDDTITLGTTALTFGVIGASTTYTSGTGISISGSVISVDTTTTPQKYSTTITGDGSTTAFTVTHNLGTKAVLCQVRDSSDYEILVDNRAATTNTVAIAFGIAPANAVTYTVIVMG